MRTESSLLIGAIGKERCREGNFSGGIPTLLITSRCILSIPRRIREDANSLRIECCSTIAKLLLECCRLLTPPVASLVCNWDGLYQDSTFPILIGEIPLHAMDFAVQLPRGGARRVSLPSVLQRFQHGTVVVHVGV